MQETEIVLGTTPRIVQRLRGTTTQTDVEQAMRIAFRLIDQLLTQHPLFDLVLDLRDIHFVDLHAHKAWHVGFLDHPILQQHTRHTAVIGSDTPTFWAEKQLLETATCRFFLDVGEGHAWLDTVQPGTQRAR